MSKVKKSKSNSWLHKTVNPVYSGLSILAVLVATLIGVASFSESPTVNQLGTVAGANTAFDQFGYNNTARIFVGLADGIDHVNDGLVYGDPTYANDRLVMKWNDEWDRGNKEGWNDPSGYNAWEDNEWNGRVSGGSGETWHYKIVWDKGCKEHGVSTVRAVKGSVQCIWGQFAVVLSQGNITGKHVWEVLAGPNGYGSAK